MRGVERWKLCEVLGSKYVCVFGPVLGFSLWDVLLGHLHFNLTFDTQTSISDTRSESLSDLASVGDRRCNELSA